MSKYTTQLRFICETLAGYQESKGLSKVAEIIAAARPQIFNFLYPMSDTDYKPTLETKIIWHYYTREIGLESFGLWQFYLHDKMNMIMPYYDQLYASAALEFNPLNDVNYQFSHAGNKSESTTKSETTSGTEGHTVTDSGSNTQSVADTKADTHWIYENDTPQGGISGLDQLNYLSKATKETDSATLSRYMTGTNSNTNTLSGTSSGSLTGSGTLTGTDAYINTISGKLGTQSYSKMLQEYRETLLNIDAMVIADLADLFMNIY